MARDDQSRRNRYGRRGRGGREQEQQNQYNPNQYNQGQSGGRDDWNRPQSSGRDDWNRSQQYGGRDEDWNRSRGYGRDDWNRQPDSSGRPSGTPNWQHDYSYGGSRREVESEGPGQDWSRQRQYNPDWSNERQWAGQGQWLDHRSYRGSQYSGEFAENRPTGWPEQRGSYGEREYGQSEGGYGEGGLSAGYGSRGRNREYADYPQDRGYVIPPMYQDFMGTGVPWESHRPQAQRQGFAGRGPKGYKRPDDRIHEEICERLTRHPGIDATEIDVKVKDGEVTLSGKVYDRRFKRMAEDEVESISGVKDVHNHIKVDHEPPGFSREWEQGVDNGRTTHEEEEDAVSARGRRERSSTGR